MTGCPSPCTGCSTTCPNLAAVLAAQVRDDAPPRGLPRPPIVAVSRSTGTL